MNPKPNTPEGAANKLLSEVHMTGRAVAHTLHGSVYVVVRRTEAGGLFVMAMGHAPADNVLRTPMPRRERRCKPNASPESRVNAVVRCLREATEDERLRVVQEAARAAVDACGASQADLEVLAETNRRAFGTAAYCAMTERQCRVLIDTVKDKWPT